MSNEEATNEDTSDCITPAGCFIVRETYQGAIDCSVMRTLLDPRCNLRMVGSQCNSGGQENEEDHKGNQTAGKGDEEVGNEY